MSDPTQTAEAETSKAKTTAKTATAQGRIMYVGPNRAYDLPLMHNQVFLGDSPPSFCTEAIQAHPHFASCFVPLANLGASLAALKTPGSVLAKAAGKVARETTEQRTKAAKGGK